MASTRVEIDGFFLSAQPAGTYGNFKLLGGLYEMDVVLGGATIAFNKVMADGSVLTLTPVPAAGNQTYNLGPGLFQIVVTGGTGTSVGMYKITGRI
jgi:hypothetical protein